MFDDIFHIEIPDIVHLHHDYSENNTPNLINSDDKFHKQNTNYVHNGSYLHFASSPVHSYSTKIRSSNNQSFLATTEHILDVS